MYFAVVCARVVLRFLQDESDKKRFGATKRQKRNKFVRMDYAEKKNCVKKGGTCHEFFLACERENEFTSNLTAHPFKFLHQSGYLLKNALLFGEVMRIERAHFW